LSSVALLVNNKNTGISKMKRPRLYTEV
jgi:hypothetical protein